MGFTKNDVPGIVADRFVRHLILSLCALLVAVQAFAQEREEGGADRAAFQFRDWTVLASGDTSEAGTTNESGDSFGFACSDSCVHYIDLNTPCRNGADYRGNAKIGQSQFPLLLTCHIFEDKFVFVADLSDEYISALGAGEEVSIDVTFDDGMSRNAHFSLKGCRQAAVAAAELSPGGDDHLARSKWGP